MHQHGNVQYLQLFCCVGIKAKRGEISNNKHKFKCTTNKRQKKEEEQKKNKVRKKKESTLPAHPFCKNVWLPD
jgi:hypothetical protein